MLKNDFQYVNDFMLKIIEKYKQDLDAKGVNEIVHYINHGEIEIAFEGLILELMSLKKIYLLEDKNEISNIAKLLKLDEESVLDADIYINMIQYFSIY